MLDYAAFLPGVKVAYRASWLAYKRLDAAWQILDNPRSAKYNCEDTNGKRLRLRILKSCVLPTSTFDRIYIRVTADYAVRN